MKRTRTLHVYAKDRSLTLGAVVASYVFDVVIAIISAQSAGNRDRAIVTGSRSSASRRASAGAPVVHFHKGAALKQIEILGSGLLTNEGESWRKQRKLVQPASAVTLRPRHRMPATVRIR